METLISPSLLSANFIDLRSDIDMINRSEADWLHLDIMDGVFVPNISFGFPVIQAVAKECKKPLDVHLMIVHPEHYIKEVAATGAMMMNVHYEACTPAPHHPGDSRCGHEGWRDAQPAHSGERARGHHLRRGHGAADEREPWLRRTEVHTALGGEDEAPAPPHRRVGQQGSHTD